MLAFSLVKHNFAIFNFPQTPPLFLKTNSESSFKLVFLLPLFFFYFLFICASCAAAEKLRGRGSMGNKMSGPEKPEKQQAKCKSRCH